MSKLLHSKVSVVEWQHKNEAGVHRTAKEFAVNRKRVRECYSTLNKKPVECLENAAIYAVTNLSQSILTKRYSSFWRMTSSQKDTAVQSKAVWTTFALIRLQKLLLCVILLWKHLSFDISGAFVCYNHAHQEPLT